MCQDSKLTPAERELESALAQLRPAAHSIDRDHMMFSAGARIARRSQRNWQAATGVLTALFVMSWLIPPGGSVPEQVADITPSPPSPAIEAEKMPGPVASPMPMSVAAAPLGRRSRVPAYVDLRNRIMAGGVDRLPRIRTSSASFAPDPPDPLYPRAFLLNRNTGDRS